MDTIGERLKELRIFKRLSRAQLAEALFVSPRTVAHWEEGTRVYDVYMLIKIANFFDVSVGYVLGIED